MFLSGNDHYVEVSSNSEMVRGMALWNFFGAHRELMLKSLGKSDKMLGRATHLIFFPNSLNEFNYT